MHTKYMYLNITNDLPLEADQVAFRNKNLGKKRGIKRRKDCIQNGLGRVEAVNS